MDGRAEGGGGWASGVRHPSWVRFANVQRTAVETTNGNHKKNKTMASSVCLYPLRAHVPSTNHSYIALSYTGPAATGEYADAQTDCPIVSMTGDAAINVLASVMHDKFNNFTLAGLASLVHAAAACKYMREICRRVSTPIDAAVIDETYDLKDVESPPDLNLNRQRFLLRALRRQDGTPAGKRFRLARERQWDHHHDGEHAGDAFLLVYRDARKFYDRPVVFAIAQPLLGGRLLCAALSLTEAVCYFGGHSRHSVFAAQAMPDVGLAAGEFNRQAANETLSVWGDDDGTVQLYDEEALLADSMNPLKISARQRDGEDDQVMFCGRTLRGDTVHELKIEVQFKVPFTTCTAFSNACFTLADDPSSIAALFGCHEAPHVACFRGSKGDAMVAAATAEKKKKKPRSKPVDNGAISVSNIVHGRRAAVKRSDIAIQRHAMDEEHTLDGQILPGHPCYVALKADLDTINAQREREGKEPLVDMRLAVPSPPKRPRTAASSSSSQPNWAVLFNDDGDDDEEDDYGDDSEDDEEDDEEDDDDDESAESSTSEGEEEA